MKQILNRLINHESISTEEAKRVLVDISEGKFNQSQIASFLTIFMMRSITLEELQGFRDA
ncbi:MAG: anthranilate phosphoribosyltransferase, partial [Psychroserpens sp.]|nr:anthranilate phosphoribosyltransferase [Psychroserpens sp.]